jgi:hypothetical protein
MSVATGNAEIFGRNGTRPKPQENTMSVATAPPPQQPLQLSAIQTVPTEIRVVSHSTLFYWWPVWVTGFVLTLLTLLDGHYMVIVPGDTVTLKGATVAVEKDGKTTSYKKNDVIVLPKGHLPGAVNTVDQPHLHAANRSGYGVFFATVLLLVIFITNVPLRGLWSIMVIGLVVLVSIIFQLAGFWEPILREAALLDIRINAAGYFLISSVLFGLWLFTILLFDRQIHMTFTSGQLKVRTEIGGGEKVYDAVGMTLEKQRSDLFRHWMIGLGSGDLIVRTSGAQAHQFEMANVLFIGRKVRAIENLLREKSIVAAPH